MSSSSAGSSSDRFRALHVVRSGRLRLPGRPEAVLGWFSPEGERRWAPGWEPEYLHPPEGAPRAGLVFRTRAGGEPTLWLLLRYDTTACEAEYVRVAPDSRMGTVSVSCTADGEDHTEVRVTYRLTGLSASGNALLAELTAPAFAEMLRDWQEAILGSLAAEGPLCAPSRGR